MARKHFLTLCKSQESFDYYGADTSDHTFKIDDVVFKVIEDPSDGYRSMLGAIDYTERHSSIFFDTPIARVRMKLYDSGCDPDHPDHPDRDDDDESLYGVCQGYSLVDVTDSHVWLQFGTDNYDDYYPIFIFRHIPKLKSDM
jgi:hypothetical protein